jgi:hypothetical protein
MANVGALSRAPSDETMIVFGGVQLESSRIWEDAYGLTHPDEMSPGYHLTMMTLSTLDLPLSAVADILTLPWTIPIAMNKKDTPGHLQKQPVDRTDWTDWGDRKSLTFDYVHGSVE